MPRVKTFPSVLITGASTGIGRATAECLAADGWQVFAGVRTEVDAAALREIAGIIPVHLDVTDTGSVAQCLATLSQTMGGRGLDALVNNAGIALGGPLEFLPLNALQKQWDINVMGAMAVTQAALPLLRLSRGRIVMMSSIAGRKTTPFLGAYSATKHALEALADALRLELHASGIRVVLVEPGCIRTPFWEKSLIDAASMAADLPASARQYYGSAMDRVMVISRRIGETGLAPDHVAKVVRRALTAGCPKARYVVGRDARVRLLAGFLPVSWQDAIIRRVIGL